MTPCTNQWAQCNADQVLPNAFANPAYYLPHQPQNEDCLVRRINCDENDTNERSKGAMSCHDKDEMSERSDSLILFESIDGESLNSQEWMDLVASGRMDDECGEIYSVPMTIEIDICNEHPLYECGTTVSSDESDDLSDDGNICWDGKSTPSSLVDMCSTRIDTEHGHFADARV